MPSMWITRNQAGEHVFNRSRPLDLRPSQALLIDACTDFCELFDREVNDGSVIKAKRYADRLEKLTDTDGAGIGPDSIEDKAIRSTIMAVRERAADYERTKEARRRGREAGALHRCEAYARALLDLQRATAYLDAHDAPELPDTLREAPATRDTMEQVSLGRIAHGLVRSCDAMGGLTAERREGARAFALELAAIIRKKGRLAGGPGE